MLNSPETNEFYRNKLSDHGISAAGVGWKDKAAQEIRFHQLIRIINTPHEFSINDLGCGTGDLIHLLDAHFLGRYAYTGYDTLDEMILKARQQFPENKGRRFQGIRDYREMKSADYTVASGIFNVKNSIDEKVWHGYILDTIAAMSAVSVRGFAFNALTKYSDADKMKSDLFYSDPLFLFDHCKRNFSRNVALIHDYGIYDFTILVRKDI